VSVLEVFQNKPYEEKQLFLLITCKEVSLEVNTEKMTYTGMFMSCEYSSEHIHNMKTANK